MTRQVFVNARIFTPADKGKPKAGQDQGELTHFSDGALLVEDGKIMAIGPKEAVLKNAEKFNDSVQKDLAGNDIVLVDCKNRCMIPGFVDPHTHMCFATKREQEFAQRLEGTPYLEILQKGGGILSSVRSVANASEEKLYTQTLKRVQTALQWGTTTVEIKSGYGLDTKNELKMLRVIGRIADSTPLDVVGTFMGAHAVPETYKKRPDDFITLVIEEMLPAVKSQGIARFCDIFCEKGVFSIDQSRRLLIAAKAMGMGLKMHADEVHDMGAAGLAAELNAISADHLLAANDKSIEALAHAGGVGTLLPATAYSLKKPYARAQVMIEKNLPVALATDCNPGSSFTESMQFIIGLAVMEMDMTPEQALTGATLNAAYAIGMADKAGSLDIGKQADFLLLDGQTPAIIAYHAGVSSVDRVYKKGQLMGNYSEHFIFGPSGLSI